MVTDTPSRIGRRAEVVRRFNRLYTKRIGILQEGWLGGPFTLTELRVLYELAHRERPSASELATVLDLDPGYVSRILRNFDERGFVEKTVSSGDARRSTLALTARGRDALAPLERRSHDEIVAMLAGMGEASQRRLVDAMRTIETLVADDRAATTYTLRAHEPGDMGWVVARNAALYAQEYGWNDEYEALVAEIVARFLRTFDARRERCWIAERDGDPVGCVFVVKKSDDVAQLRLLLVEPSARGLGIGRRLVDECIRFAARAGYATLMLWTNDILHAARRIYVEAGFELTAQESHHSFGHDLVGQTWELPLR